jgi:16S rRNA (cytidine1402-2'-O)-methyltransferase
MPLWIVATPIGTIADLSARAREVLGSAAVVASEDTRVTRRLLTAAQVSAPALTALHAHNEDARAEEIAARALTEDVVLVTDAGTPGVSDPGAVVVAAAHRAGVRIRSVPGPSALAAGLAASGFSAAPSTFLGFPPRKGRASWARSALTRPETLVMFEASSRVAGLVADLAALSPQREAALCRELSKHFEEVVRAPLEGLARLLAERDLRGECVLVVGPGDALRAEEQRLPDDAGLKDVAASLGARWGVPRREVYQALLQLEQAHRPSAHRREAQ